MVRDRAGAGFGRAITEAASVAGDVVVAAARRPEALAALAAEHSGRIAPIHLDVTDTEQFALEGYSEALAAEVAPFGIRVLIVEPGAFRTGFAGPALVESAVIGAYDHTVGASRSYIEGVDGIQPGQGCHRHPHRSRRRAAAAAPCARRRRCRQHPRPSRRGTDATARLGAPLPRYRVRRLRTRADRSAIRPRRAPAAPPAPGWSAPAS